MFFFVNMFHMQVQQHTLWYSGLQHNSVPAINSQIFGSEQAINIKKESNKL